MAPGTSLQAKGAQHTESKAESLTGKVQEATGWELTQMEEGDPRDGNAQTVCQASLEKLCHPFPVKD